MLQEINIMKNKEEIRSKFHRIVIPKLIWKKPLTSQDRALFLEWKEKFNPDLNILKFYTNKHVLFEIVKYLKNNELILHESVDKEIKNKPKPIRHLFASKIDNLLTHFYFYKFLEQPKTIYCGLTNFKIRPIAPLKIQDKAEWQYNFWTGGEKAYLDYIKSYNFGLDIDGKNFQESYKDALKVFKLFKKFNVRFSVWCSGKKGFHYLIPYEEMEELLEPFNIDKTISACRGLMLDLVKILKLKDVDYLIYSPTRYLKTPYTLDNRNNRVIYPLSDEDFLGFPNNPDKYMSHEYCVNQKDLGFRGVYINRPSNPENFKNMIDYIGEKLK